MNTNFSTDKFQCASDGECIDMSNVCDGEKDCSDQSDEADNRCLLQSKSSIVTTTTTTTIGTTTATVSECPEFRCQNGLCIGSENLCDGQNNCE